MKKNKHFGEHVTIDGYGGNPEILNNKDVVFFVLSDLTKKLKMKMLTKPIVILAPSNGLKDPGGLSGFVVIAESHIAMHTFPKRRFISADVYSCQNNMNTKKIIDYFTKTFELHDVEVNFIKRGTKYPTKNLI